MPQSLKSKSEITKGFIKKKKITKIQSKPKDRATGSFQRRRRLRSDRSLAAMPLEIARSDRSL